MADTLERMTVHEVMRAVNTGADLTLNAVRDAGRLDDELAANLANLVVCAIGSVLHNPEATIEDVLRDSFAGTIEQWREELGDDVVDRALAPEEVTG